VDGWASIADDLGMKKSNSNLLTEPRIEYRSESSDRGVILLHGRDAVFGRWDGSEFIPSMTKASKTYASAAGVLRAIAQWLAG